MYVGLTVAGCASLVDIIPSRSMTDSAIVETQVRIGMQLQTDSSLPQTIESLPIRSGYANRITDGWRRPLIYAVNKDSFTLTSLGKDGLPGGTGDNADVVATFRIVNGKPEEVRP